jgi:integrase
VGDIDFDEQKITVKRTWLQGRVGEPKTATSAAPILMHLLLGEAMLRWRLETPYFRRERLGLGIVPAAYARFGRHDFRHSLASFLIASGTDTKTVRDLLRQVKVQTTAGPLRAKYSRRAHGVSRPDAHGDFQPWLTARNLIAGASRV